MVYGGVFSLHFYGPAAGAAVSTDSTGSVIAGINAIASGGAEIGGAGSVPNAKATRLVNSPATITGTGSLVQALPKGRARATALVNVGAAPSAFDIAQAIWNAPSASYDVAGSMGEKVNAAGSAGDPLTGEVENSLSLRDTMRLMLAVMTGKSTVSGNTITFRDNADSKNRVTATMSGRNRTAVTLDAD